MRRVAAGLLGILALTFAGSSTSANSVNTTDQTWTCSRALTSYGPLPIVVNQTWTKTDTTRFGVVLGANCAGTGQTGECQLILHSNANGLYGPFDDAIRITRNMPGARNMVICGSADCGKPRAGAHQDGIQAIGGTNVVFKGFQLGLNGQGGPSCQGAGGAVFYSHAGDYHPTNMRIEAGRFKACNAGLKEGGAGQSGHVEDATFQTGYDKAHPTVCRNSEGRQIFSGSPCNLANPLVTDVNVVCDKWPWVG